MLEELKKRVYEANMLLPKHGLVTFTWGNVSEIDRETGYFAIKPSGVDYDKLTPDDMVIVDLEGNKIEGKYNPSSDTATHVELYKAFSKIGGIVHTHSPWATSWAQAGRGIPCYGTTHADYMYGEIPCVRCLTKEEIEGAYEKNTGVLIADYFKDKDYEAVPAVLCKNHGPFTWGKDGHEAVHNAVVLEEVAKMAARCEMINPRVQPAPQELQDKHYYRKHGVNGVSSYIDWIVTSEEAGAEKPAGRFFDLCAQKAGAAPSQCAFIGDSLEKDVEGALKNGFKGVWYHKNPTEDEKRSYPVIDSFCGCIQDDRICLGKEILI